MVCSGDCGERGGRPAAPWLLPLGVRLALVASSWISKSSLNRTCGAGRQQHFGLAGCSGGSEGPSRGGTRAGGRAAAAAPPPPLTLLELPELIVEGLELLPLLLGGLSADRSGRGLAAGEP